MQDPGLQPERTTLAWQRTGARDSGERSSDRSPRGARAILAVRGRSDFPPDHRCSDLVPEPAQTVRDAAASS
jgi:hypothetical protein